MKVLNSNFKIPENPHKGNIDIFNNIRLATKQGYDEGQQSILSQLKEVSLNKLFGEYLTNYVVSVGEVASGEIRIVANKSFEEFVKERIS